MVYHETRMTMPQMLAALPKEDPAFQQAVRMHNFERGETIARPEDLRINLFLLMTGKAQLICLSPEGRRLVLATLEPGAIFGEGALLDAGDPNAFAEAMDTVTVWTLPALQAKVMTARHPILGWGLLQTFGQRLAQVESRLEDVAYKKLPERLAGLLLEMSDHEEMTINGTSHQALADTLGTYRETVSAILRSFKREGYVDLGYRRIHILDVEGLELAAGFF